MKRGKIMFIEKLTQDDFKKYFQVNTVSRPFKISDNEIYVSYERQGVCFDNVINCRYSDFESSNGDDLKWRKFMYNKFGDEYLKKYKEYLNNKITELINELITVIN